MFTFYLIFDSRLPQPSSSNIYYCHQTRNSFLIVSCYVLRFELIYRSEEDEAMPKPALDGVCKLIIALQEKAHLHGPMLEARYMQGF